MPVMPITCNLGLIRLTFLPLLSILIWAVACAAHPAKSAAERKLERLARIRFPNQSKCEKALLRVVTTGDVAYCDVDAVPDDTGEKPQPYDVGAKLIRWLVVDPVASKLVDPKGIQVYGARVRDAFDLKFASVPFPLMFRNSLFLEKIDVSYSQLINLDVQGSHFPGITAENVTDRGDFDLFDATSDGEVDLLEGYVAGDLLSDRAILKNPTGYALLANNLKTSGSVFLRNVEAEGEVNFVGANIGSSLEFEAGTLKNPKGRALNADTLRTEGSVFLTNVTAEGEVRLGGANIGGELGCEGGRFKNPEGEAFFADSLRTGGALFLSNVKAEGEVDLFGANIGQSLDCEGGTFKNPKGRAALNAETVKTGGSVFLRDVGADGEVDVAGADVSGDLDCGGCNFENSKGTALFAENLKVSNNAYLRDDVRALSVDGELDFHGAEVKGGLQIIDNPKSKSGRGYILDLREAAATYFMDRETSWPEMNNLKLDGFVYGHLVRGAPTDAGSRLDWLKRQGTNEFVPQPYEQLAKVLREAGDDAGAKTVLIAMENDRWRNGKEDWLERGWGFITWATIGYGYDVSRALWCILGLILIGSFLFIRGGPERRGWIISTEVHPERYRPFNGFIYSLETLLPLVDLYQAKHWVPDAQSKAGKYLRLYLWGHTLLGWFFASMLIAGVAGLVQK